MKQRYGEQNALLRAGWRRRYILPTSEGRPATPNGNLGLGQFLKERNGKVEHVKQIAEKLPLSAENALWEAGCT